MLTQNILVNYFQELGSHNPFFIFSSSKFKTFFLKNKNNSREGRRWRPQGAEYNVTTKEECEALDLCVIGGKIESNCTKQNKKACVAR